MAPRLSIIIGKYMWSDVELKQWAIKACYRLWLKKEQISQYVVTDIKGYYNVNSHSYAVINMVSYVTIPDFLANGTEAFRYKYWEQTTL